MGNGQSFPLLSESIHCIWNCVAAGFQPPLAEQESLATFFLTEALSLRLPYRTVYETEDISAHLGIATGFPAP